MKRLILAVIMGALLASTGTSEEGRQVDRIVKLCYTQIPYDNDGPHYLVFNEDKVLLYGYWEMVEADLWSMDTETWWSDWAG